jgi:hypothetical protein
MKDPQAWTIIGQYKPAALFVRREHAAELRRKPMRSVCIALVAVIAAAVAGLAAEQTWRGRISDSMCGAKHKPAAEHGTSNASARECTLACVKNGAQYVFVSQGKVYKIANQDFTGLQEHAGKIVQLEGELTGDTIQVSSILVPPGTRKNKGEKSSL